MQKPLILRGLQVFAACNRLATYRALKDGNINYGDEISEPIIVMAKDVHLADYIIRHSTVGFDTISSESCEISHQLLDTPASEVRPLVKLVTFGNLGFPDFFNN